MAKKIYVVEDNEEIRESLIEFFKGEGYEVFFADNGQSALDYLCSAIVLPDLILMDLMMPIKDGFQFCTEQALNEKIANIPVIILSGDILTKQMFEKTRACAYILKPLDLFQLLETVKKYCLWIGFLIGVVLNFQNFKLFADNWGWFKYTISFMKHIKIYLN